MHKTRDLKIFIYLILTVIALVLWVGVWSSFTSDVGQTTYEDAVFVKIEEGSPEEGENGPWTV